MPGPLAVPIALGAASLIGGLMGNRNRSKEAAKDRRFQERMRNTSWQAGVADMEAAGINPAVAYSQGGAAQPGGAMASQDDVISPAVNSAQAARKLSQELKNMEASEMRDYEAAGASKMEAKYKSRMAELVLRQQRNVELTNELAGLRMFSARNLANLEKGKLGGVLPYAERLMGLTPRLNFQSVGTRLPGGAMIQRTTRGIGSR